MTIIKRKSASPEVGADQEKERSQDQENVEDLNREKGAGQGLDRGSARGGLDHETEDQDQEIARKGLDQEGEVEPGQEIGGVDPVLGQEITNTKRVRSLRDAVKNGTSRKRRFHATMMPRRKVLKVPMEKKRRVRLTWKFLILLEI